MTDPARLVDMADDLARIYLEAPPVPHPDWGRLPRHDPCRCHDGADTTNPEGEPMKLIAHQPVEGVQANEEIKGVDGERAAWLIANGYAYDADQKDPADHLTDTSTDANADPTLARNREAADQAPVSVHPDHPARSASKADWVAYAVSQGATEDDAEAMTKAELVDTYGTEA